MYLFQFDARQFSRLIVIALGVAGVAYIITSTAELLS